MIDAKEHEPSRSVPPGGATHCAVAADVIDPGLRLSPSALGWLVEQANRAFRVLGTGGEVRARVVGDAEMAAAHERYSGVAGTTDVLTFDLAEGRDEAADVANGEAGAAARSGRSRLVDADILVCFDEAGRQAGARGHSVERELLLYMIHGMLHCLGHDDHEPEAAARMHAEEDRVMGVLGIGATYAPGTGGGVP